MRSSTLLSSSLFSLALSAATLSLVAGCSRDAAPRGDTTTASAASAPAPAAPNAEPAAPGAAAAVAVGKAPPDFSAKAHDGADLKLSALKGKQVVLYFYPKDETPGCTKEACAFRDAWKELDKKGIVLVGISTDNAESHKAFAKHHELPFHLVSDETGSIAKSFGVPNHGGFLGRQTFVIGADGNVKKIYRDVDVTKHAAEILADVTS
jgi:peroxiredoxin Q/BCP